MTNAQDAISVAAYNIVDAQQENVALRAENKRLREALEDALWHVDSPYERERLRRFIK